MIVPAPASPPAFDNAIIKNNTTQPIVSLVGYLKGYFSFDGSSVEVEMGVVVSPPPPILVSSN